MVILLLMELAFAGALGFTGHIYRPETVRAYGAWQQNPTKETRHEFERQVRIADFRQWAFSSAVFLVLAGTTLLVYRLRKDEQGAARNSRRAGQLTGL